MARNSEKAVTALARWRNLQLKEAGKLVIERRPNFASDERDLRRAEKWRNQVIREIAKKVTAIQNAGLGEFKIRDLNDEINKLLREKVTWEQRIKELDGPDYKKIGPKLLDKEGKEVPGSKGYKYFGAAKELTGVKELFEQEAAQNSGKKSRSELLREIDAEYYGYLDDDDNLLVVQEEKCEAEARKAKIEAFKKDQNAWTEEDGDSNNEDEEEEEMEEESEGEDLKGIDSEEEERGFYERNLNKNGAVADTVTTTTATKKKLSKATKKKSSSSIKTGKLHIDVPTIQDVEQAILEKKKKELMSKYVSAEQMDQETEAKRLIGKS